MRAIIKGMNYTEVTTTGMNNDNETVQYWILKKPRKPEQCGVWLNDKQIATFETMAEFVKPIPIDQENPKSSFVPIKKDAETPMSIDVDSPHTQIKGCSPARGLSQKGLQNPSNEAKDTKKAEQ